MRDLGRVIGAYSLLHVSYTISTSIQMDVGVGSFIFSQGIVSAIPLLKDPKHLTSPLVPIVMNALRKSLPIIFLGILRVVMVKGTDYPVTYRFVAGLELSQSSYASERNMNRSMARIGTFSSPSH